MTIKNIQYLDSVLLLFLIGIWITIGGIANFILAGLFGLLLVHRIPIFYNDGWDVNGSRPVAYFGLGVTVVLIIINLAILLIKNMMI